MCTYYISKLHTYRRLTSVNYVIKECNTKMAEIATIWAVSLSFTALAQAGILSFTKLKREDACKKS